MISGKCFSQLCKWVIDPRYPDRNMFDYRNAVTGDWIFLNGDCLDKYTKKIPYFHTKKFNLVVHNSDKSFTYETLKTIPCVNHVYAINTKVQHPLVTTIPLGFVDNQLSFLNRGVDTSQERDIEIYCNFTMSTNTPKRNDCLSAFESDTRVTIETNLSVTEYYNRLSRSKFVLCPEGTGMDTHRVYEALLCGATPVVLRNSLAHLYEKLPICILDKWTDPLYVPENKRFVTTVMHYVS